MAAKRDANIRFLEKINKDGKLIDEKLGKCWEWNGRLHKSNGGDYAVFYPKHGKSILAIRYAYEYFIGIIPEGMCPDHLCNNAECVNPYHIQIVTQRENILRGNGTAANFARRTHCDKGHEYTPENTRITKAGARLCRTCRRETSRLEKLKYRSKNNVTN